MLKYLVRVFSGTSTTYRQHFLTTVRRCCRAPLSIDFLRGRVSAQGTCANCLVKNMLKTGHICVEYAHKALFIYSYCRLQNVVQAGRAIRNHKNRGLRLITNVINNKVSKMRKYIQCYINKYTL